MDLIGPIDPPSSKGHKYILCLVDQHSRWGEAVPLYSLSAKETCEVLLNIGSRTEIYLLLKGEGFVEKNSAVSWVTVLDLWKWYFCRSLTKNYAAFFLSFGICFNKKVRFKIEYTSYGCNLTAQVLRMLEQFVVSRIVDIDILMQIWKNRVKQINFVLEWVRWVGSEIIPAKGTWTREQSSRLLNITIIVCSVCEFSVSRCQVIYSQFVLAIHQNDHQARRRFVEWAQNEIAVVPDFHKRILFSDEAHFWLNGYANKQNCRIWSEANPQVYVKTPLHPEKLTVWCALWAGGILIQKR
ncbi:retrovirus-related Pol polyprotein from transposon opus [Trichonephila clavipes]|nr:retrovirus-related Pol polyprotein from transposon opus [Trichonephila clavipes]